MKLLIQNGRVLNPATNTDEQLDVLTDGHKIIKIEKQITDQADQVIDAQGCYVMPGLIDLHVHLRDPGLTYKETLETGTAAAAKGGFTTIVAMANTNPVIDSVETWQSVMDHAHKKSPIQVIQVASLTKGMLGRELSPIRDLKEAGLTVLSEDGKSVMNANLFRDAMKEAAACNLVVLDHCEDQNMKGTGAINEGEKAKELQLKGITNAVEDVIIARDILIAKETNARLHICHCSTKDSVRMIGLAKKEGLSVTGEVCPHHFTLCDEDIQPGDSNYKMAPPLRSRKDREGLIKGLQNGSLDAISTDHAPHADREKGTDIGKAAFGIVGLETAVALTVSELVRPGYLTPMQMAEKMSYNPARIIQLDKGNLEVGKDADITIIDPDAKYRIDKETFASMGRNTPFHGREVYGKVAYTISEGEIVYATKE